jgi:hypothetical protein
MQGAAFTVLVRIEQWTGSKGLGAKDWERNRASTQSLYTHPGIILEWRHSHSIAAWQTQTWAQLCVVHLLCLVQAFCRKTKHVDKANRPGRSFPCPELYCFVQLALSCEQNADQVAARCGGDLQALSTCFIFTSQIA